MKKAFTLLELVIVIGLLGLLIGSLGKVFSYKNVNPIKYDTCYINITGKLDNFLQDAILQRSVYTGYEWKKVDNYTIIFDVNNQKIDFIYSGAGVKETIHLNGTGEDRQYDCFTTSYHTLLSGDELKIDIKPGLQVDNQAGGDSGMIVYKNGTKLNNGSTGGVNLYYCEGSGGNCYERNKIIVDSKVQLFKKYFCMVGDKNPCPKWSE